MDKQDLEHSNNGRVVKDKKEPLIHSNNMDESQIYHFEEKKPGLKEYSLYMTPKTLRNHLLTVKCTNLMFTK